jgi:hypothetical protein
MVNLDLSNFLTGNVFLVLLLAGFILAFFGKTFFKATWFLVGGLLGAAIGLALGYFLGPYVYTANNLVCPIIGAVVGFIAGGFFVLNWVRKIMCLMIAAAAFIMAFAIAGALGMDMSTALIVGIVVAAIIFVIVYIKFDDILSVMTAFLGGMIIGALVALRFFAGNLIVIFAVGIPVAIVGMVVQLHLHKNYPEHSYDKDKDPSVKNE